MSEPKDADSASTSPSPSTSIAKTELTLVARLVTTRSVKDCEPSFSYHATVSEPKDADSASTSPSPSTSRAKTAEACPPRACPLKLTSPHAVAAAARSAKAASGARSAMRNYRRHRPGFTSQCPTARQR